MAIALSGVELLLEASPAAARQVLVERLIEDALIKGRVTLSSGAQADYLIDAKRVILRQPGFFALAVLLRELANRWDATAVGGLTLGADPIACAALAGDPDLKGFFVRKEPKQHGLQKLIEGPPLNGTDRCIIVDDVITTGGSTIQAIDAVKSEGLEIAGVVCILDRLAGGAEKIRAASGGAPFEALTTIDDVYPERPDR